MYPIRDTGTTCSAERVKQTAPISPRLHVNFYVDEKFYVQSAIFHGKGIYRLAPSPPVPLRAPPLTTPLDDSTAPASDKAPPELAATDPRQQFELSAERLKALAESQRLQIISLLLSGPKRVGDLATKIGHEMAKVSHHLGVLRQSRLVTATKRGRFVEYALHPDTHIERQGSREELVIGFGLVNFSLPMPSHETTNGASPIS